MVNGGPPIVVVGSINMDLVSSVSRIPQAGETILGSGFHMHSGGKGANQAVGVARLQYPVAIIGSVGRDAFGAELCKRLQEEGVDTSHVTKVDAPTGTATIVVDDAGENCIIVSPGANSMVTPHLLQEHIALLDRAGMVLAQLEIPTETVESLAILCAERGKPLILDPAPAQSLTRQTLKKITWFTPNETEAHFYARNSLSDEEILTDLLSQGPRGVILKQGARGVTMASQGVAPQTIAAVRVHAVDATAAGDAFNAAFAVWLMNGHTALDSARFAVAAAAISVTRRGAQPSLASRDEVSAALLSESKRSK